MLKALSFDVEATLADTEAAHRDAFHATFIDVGCAYCFAHLSNPGQLMFQDQAWVDWAGLHQRHNNTLTEAA